MHKWKKLPLLAAIAVLAVPAAPAGAQISGDKVRKRYQRQTKGSSIDDFVRHLKSDEPGTRLEAVKSLEDAKDPKAIEYLVQALGDPDMRVRAKAIDALGNLRAREASPVLVQHLFLRDTKVFVKRRLLASLGKIGDERATGSIIEFMRRELGPDTLGTAIFALGEIGSAEALPALEQIQKTTDNPTLRRLAKQALTKVRYHQTMIETEAKEPQTTFLKDDQPPRQ